MRALCGAIITAGALIGLGLTAMGIGQRYSLERTHGPDGQFVAYKLSHLDGPLLLILVFVLILAVIGLGVTFVGLGYHHHRREREHELHRAGIAPARHSELPKVV